MSDKDELHCKHCGNTNKFKARYSSVVEIECNKRGKNVKGQSLLKSKKTAKWDLEGYSCVKCGRVALWENNDTLPLTNKKS
jgi:hypothetical protein